MLRDAWGAALRTQGYYNNSVLGRAIALFFILFAYSSLSLVLLPIFFSVDWPPQEPHHGGTRKCYLNGVGAERSLLLSTAGSFILAVALNTGQHECVCRIDCARPLRLLTPLRCPLMLNDCPHPA